jgi:hypothetical protein
MRRQRTSNSLQQKPQALIRLGFSFDRDLRATSTHLSRVGRPSCAGLADHASRSPQSCFRAPLLWDAVLSASSRLPVVNALGFADDQPSPVHLMGRQMP